MKSRKTTFCKNYCQIQILFFCKLIKLDNAIWFVSTNKLTISDDFDCKLSTMRKILNQNTNLTIPEPEKIEIELDSIDTIPVVCESNF